MGTVLALGGLDGLLFELGGVVVGGAGCEVEDNEQGDGQAGAEGGVKEVDDALKQGLRRLGRNEGQGLGFSLVHGGLPLLLGDGLGFDPGVHHVFAPAKVLAVAREVVGMRGELPGSPPLPERDLGNPKQFADLVDGQKLHGGHLCGGVLRRERCATFKFV